MCLFLRAKTRPHVKKADVITQVKRRSRLWKAFMVAAVAVVFATTYMLILPAITLENKTICGMEEHTHTEECYQEVATLSCTVEDADHQHTADCYTVTQELICQQEEHTHNSGCYADEAEEGQPLLASLFSAASNDTAIDFTDMITKVSMEVNNQTLNANSSGKYEIDDWTGIKFYIRYVLPGNKLSASQTKISYQLPFQIKAQETGNVYDNGTQAGTYVITQSGLITITFNNDYVTKNVNGSQLTGDIAFTSQGSLVRDGADEKTVKFNSSISYVFTKPVTEPGEVETSDLSASEKVLSTDGYKGTIALTLSSNAGTNNSAITVTNNLDKLKINGQISIKKPDGSTYTASSFPLTLDALSAGQSYVITYNTEFTGTVEQNQAVYASTNVTAKWTGVTGEKNVSAGSRYTYGGVFLKASGSAGNTSVTWTIDVNSDKLDIAGATLNDSYLGKVLKSSLRVKRDWNTIDETSGDYAVQTNASGYVSGILFNSSANGHYYQISYDMPVSLTLAKATYENAVTLVNNGLTYQATPTATYQGFNPVENTYKQSSLNSDGSRTVNWNATLNGGGVDDNGNSITAAGYEFSIDLDGTNHVFTKANLTALSNTLGSDGTIYAVDDSGNSVPLSSVSQTGRFKKLLVRMNKALAAGETLPVSYQTTVTEQPTTSTETYTSKLALSGYEGIGVGANYTYQNPISDDNNDNPDEVSKEDLEKNGNKLTWKNSINIPSDVDEDVIITDEFPDGTDLTQLTFLDTDLDLDKGKTTINYNGTDYEVETEKKDGKVTITIPKNLVAQIRGQNKNLITVVSLDEDSIPTEATDYENKVSLAKKATPDLVLGSLVNVTSVGGSSFDKASLQKSGTQVDEYVTYRVLVNPSNYVSDGDTKYFVRDTLKFDTWWLWKDFELVPSSVKVYKEDGKTPLSSYLYSYTTSEEVTNGTKEHGEVKKYMDFTIDYGGNVILEYTYKLVATQYGSNSAEITNAVAIGKTTPDQETTEWKGQIYAQKSSATVTATGATIYKIDETNANVKLDGAKFDLYKYNGSSYVKDGSYTTADGGKISLPDLSNDTAYYLEETAAPSGYSLPDNPKTYFYINNGGTKVKPDDFNGQELLSGGNLYIANQKAPSAQVLIQKVWIDKDGTDVSADKNGSIAVSLYKSTQNDLDVNGDIASQATKVEGDFTVSGDAKQWILLIDQLPLTENGQTLYYYVQETGVNGYEATYAATQQYTDTLGYTKVTITNTETAKEYVLPHTGGSGLFGYLAAGMLLMGGSALLMLRKLRKRKEGFV